MAARRRRELLRAARGQAPDGRAAGTHEHLERDGQGHGLLLHRRAQRRRGDRGLPHAHGQGAGLPQVDIGFLAEPRALQDGRRDRGHARRVSQATHPRRQYRTRLELLEARQLGRPHLRGLALPRPAGHARQRTPHERPIHDLGMAQVLLIGGQLQGARRQGMDVPPGHRRRHTRLAGLRRLVLRCLRCRRTQDVLAADERQPLHQIQVWHRRLVDGCL